jgi:DNA-binding response OmpR family regulator
LPKPFDLSLLIARINALLRRREWFRKDQTKTNGNVFNIGNKTIDFETLELRSDHETVQLTLMEAELLRYLIDHDGKIVSRSAILADVWNLREDTDTRAIDNFIVRLRKYLEDEPSQPRHLLTVRGVGYRFVS